MPTTEQSFFDLLNIFFPTFFDIKYLMNSCNNLNGGLQKVAEQLNVERIGPQHQAGSDSLLTALAFFKLKEIYFNNKIDEDKYANQLFGLGQSVIKEKRIVEKDDEESSSTISEISSGSNSSAANNNNTNSNGSNSLSAISSFPGLLPSSKFLTPDPKAKKKSVLNGTITATPPDFTAS
jgi:CCR4-NOT transcription complex subunit 7/8